MIYWLYFVPLWLSGLITVLVLCVFGIIGLLLTRKWVPSLHHVSVSYNDIVGWYFGSITVLYGITLGLLMVGDWTTHSETQERVDEARCIPAGRGQCRGRLHCE